MPPSRISGTSVPMKPIPIALGMSSRWNRTWEEKIMPSDDHLSPMGRVMEVLSEHLCEGWLEGYVLTGRHGLFATYEAFAMIIDSMMVQHTKWLEGALDLPWREPVSSVNILL